MKQQSFEILYTDKIDQQYAEIIRSGFNVDSESQGFGIIEPYAFYCIDDKKNFIGGISGNSFFGCLRITNLFVCENSRNQNYGTLLVNKAEILAKERNCKFICLMTMSWQAKAFYEKLGFDLEFVQRGYNNNSEAYHFRKEINN